MKLYSRNDARHRSMPRMPPKRQCAVFIKFIEWVGGTTRKRESICAAFADLLLSLSLSSRRQTSSLYSASARPDDYAVRGIVSITLDARAICQNAPIDNCGNPAMHPPQRRFAIVHYIVRLCGGGTSVCSNCEARTFAAECLLFGNRAVHFPCSMDVTFCDV